MSISNEELKHQLEVEHPNFKKLRDMYGDAVGDDYPRLGEFAGLISEIVKDTEKQLQQKYQEGFDLGAEPVEAEDFTSLREESEA